MALLEVRGAGYPKNLRGPAAGPSSAATRRNNDPLPQGRNFSYLDTQLKRLGRPNCTSLPINAGAAG
ncbi:MAG: catalase [Streptosporangiaceae bacterium]